MKLKKTPECKAPTAQDQNTASEPQNDTPELAETTKADTEIETTSTETIIHSDSAMYDEKEESELLISMLNEIELQPVDSPNRANIPFGGGYIMNIEGGERYILLGGRYLQIGDKYYYDANDKSDTLSAKIGYVLYDYYGEP